MSILCLENVGYRYKGSREHVLESLRANFSEGKFYALIGQSGVGKSTLLSLLAGLDRPIEGQIKFAGEDIATKGYSYHRRKHISLIFQNYNLIDYLTALENVRMVNSKAEPKLLLDLGLAENEIKRNVLQLSGGQQQRVAVARALAAKAPIILADEPTGNLDPETADGIIKLLQVAAHEHNKCVIVVTHSQQVAEAADCVLELKNKQLKESNRYKLKAKSI